MNPFKTRAVMAVGLAAATAPIIIIVMTVGAGKSITGYQRRKKPSGGFLGEFGQALGMTEADFKQARQPQTAGMQSR